VFGAGFEVFPFLADSVGFLGIDLLIAFEGFGDGVEKFAEIADHDAGFVENRFVGVLAEIGDGIGGEEAAGFVAEPADEADVLGELVHFADAVEGVFGAGGFGVGMLGGGLAPFIDKRGGNFQAGRDRFDAEVVYGVADDFVGFHNLNCSG